MRRSHDAVDGIEGENDFSGKRYVWVKDQECAFVKGWVVEDLEDNRLLVQCEDGSVSFGSQVLCQSAVLTWMDSNEKSTRMVSIK